MTQALGMAPGITTLYVYVGSTDTAILGSMSSHTPLPSQLSSSWTWTPADPSIDDPYFLKMAAQGQSYFQASGDSRAWSSSNDLYPSEDANVICVGGTDLQTSSAGGPWSSETAWVDSGGGISPSHIAIPSWQQLAGVINSSNKGSTSYRNGPDVSANADFTFYVCADQTTCTANYYGGTSFATPMWAGYVALANQQAVANGDLAVGFINPAIYPIGVSSNYAADFHDITSGSNGLSAVNGYDLVTGWGSPNGAALINALAVSSSPNFTISASPSSQTVVQGGGATYTATVAPLNGFTGAVAFGVSGLPSGTTGIFSPASVTGSGSSTLTVTTSTTTPAGSYTLTLTGTSGSLSHNATVTLVVNSSSSADFTLAATPSSVTISPGSVASYTDTVSALNGFTGKVTFSVSGLPSGGRSLFSPASVTGSGSVTMHIGTSTSTPAGTYTLTVTGTSGSLQHSATVALVVSGGGGSGSFTISASPGTQTVTRGSNAAYTVTITPSGGFSGIVSLRTMNVPSGATASYSPTTVTGSGSSTLTISTSTGMATGTFTITVGGVSGSITKTTTVTLIVQ